MKKANSFEKSGKDKDPKGMKEGSKADKKLDAMQEAKMTKKSAGRPKLNVKK